MIRAFPLKHYAHRSKREKITAPAKLVTERVNFSHPDLSRAMNRLLRNCGRTIVRKKLESLKEDRHIQNQELNGAYSSQGCRCGYVDAKNRKSQSEFECKFCGLTMNADVKSAKVIDGRSSAPNLGAKYISKRSVLDELVKRFIERRKVGADNRSAL